MYYVPPKSVSVCVPEFLLLLPFCWLVFSFSSPSAFNSTGGCGDCRSYFSTLLPLQRCVICLCLHHPSWHLSLSLSLIWHKQIDWTRITRPQFAVTGLCLFVAYLSVSHTHQRESLPELNHVVGGGVSQCHHHQVFTSTSKATCIKYTNSQSISRTCASVRPRALLLQA